MIDALELNKASNLITTTTTTDPSKSFADFSEQSPVTKIENLLRMAAKTITCRNKI